MDVSIVTLLRPPRGMSRQAMLAALGRAAPGAHVPLARPALRVLPLGRHPVALAHGDVSVDGLIAHRYRVTTAIPREGEPGAVGLLSLLRRRSGLDDATFQRRWFRGHSPLAMAVHPMVRYERHAVLEALDRAPPLDGIVLEHFRSAADVIRPWRFFGGRGRPLRDAVAVVRDAAGFLDLGRLENHLVRTRP